MYISRLIIASFLVIHNLYIRVLLRIFNKETQFNLCNTNFQITMNVNVLVCVHTEYVSILMVATSVYATLVSHLRLMVEPV